MISADHVIWGIAIIAVGITFLNPGGLIIGLAIALFVLGGRYGLPFARDVYTARQSGVSSAKVRQKARDMGSGRNREGEP
ncbi:hypothetical protein [Natronosalvus amylolyticus]|uniref:hypothetical protein n=1 Tax=Natronosalvus amylolyticus TaxID=2961994 RepID=UPI0020C9F716|nr:hypothetical protein [Natronosalvus amylolyticus]